MSLSNCSSDIGCLCCPTIEFCRISSSLLELIVIGLVANIGIGIVGGSFSARSSNGVEEPVGCPITTGSPYYHDLHLRFSPCLCLYLKVQQTNRNSCSHERNVYRLLLYLLSNHRILRNFHSACLFSFCSSSAVMVSDSAPNDVFQDSKRSLQMWPDMWWAAHLYGD